MYKLAIIDHVVSAGGVERFLHGLVGGLLELPESAEWEIHVVLAARSSGGYDVYWPDHLTAPNLHFHYLRGDKLSKLMDKLATARRILSIPGTAKAQHTIPQVIQQYGPRKLQGLAGDVSLWIEQFCSNHDFDVAYFSYPYFIECPRLSAPIVATPHDFNYKSHNTLAANVRASVDRQMPGWLQSSSRLVVSSDFIFNELRNFYPKFSPKTQVIRLGIPRAHRIPSKAELRAYKEKVGLPDGFLLVAGGVVPHKNHKIVFKALGHLRRKGIKIPVVCTGPYSDWLQPSNKQKWQYTREVQEVAEQAGLQYGKDFWGLGYVEELELECLYRMATALVVPSLYEAGSFPAREAMQVGCPVIYSDIPPLKEELELIEGNAWTFDPFSYIHLAIVIEELLSDPLKTQEKAARAAKLVADVFCWKRTAEGYLSIFKELV
jgi:glycosyltransferase involved in cell wall biosynthesis